MADTIVNVVPDYGYGWMATGGSRARDTPAPFQVRLNYEGEGEWGGLIETANHEFDGMTVRMSQRVEQWEGTVNRCRWRCDRLGHDQRVPSAQGQRSRKVSVRLRPKADIRLASDALITHLTLVEPMRCNFRIDQFVAFEGEFGYLDVHNCYDLVKVELLPEERQVRFSFEGNEHTRPEQAYRFALELNEVSLLETHLGGSEPGELEVDEISFRMPEDRDYDVSGSFDGVPRPGEHLVFRLFEGHVRIAAGSADVVPVRSNVISFPDKNQ